MIRKAWLHLWVRVIVCVTVIALAMGGVAWLSYRHGQVVKRQETIQESKPKEPNLDGHWKQTNNDGQSVWHEADIKDNHITIKWVRKDGAKQLYWQGVLTKPETQKDAWRWEAKADQKSMQQAMKGNMGDIVGRDTVKRIAYDKGFLIYTVDEFGGQAVATLKRESM